MENTDHLDEWFDRIRAFVSDNKDQTLCRFDEVNVTRLYTDVEKSFLLKYDPQEYLNRVDNLNWMGTPITDIVLRKPVLPTDISCDVWLISSIVREWKIHSRSYYDEDGDPFDPNNLANWDGDQQIGFRD